MFKMGVRTLSNAVFTAKKGVVTANPPQIHLVRGPLRRFATGCAGKAGAIWLQHDYLPLPNMYMYLGAETL